MPPTDPDRLRAVAAEYGLTLDEETAERYVGSVENTLERAGTVEPTLPESDRAADVEAGDDEYNAFRQRFSLPPSSGPLSELTLATKENVCVAGVPMTCGSDGFAFTPEYSATVVRRLRAAGADLVGTTNMDEFALFTTGETCAHGEIANPAAPGRVPGGSSGGSGAAVAAGLVDAALGSDTGGSIRIPASFCGVVGLKPTHRAVPRFGFVDLAPSLDHVGPLARDVETAARVFDAVSGPDPRDPSTLAVPAATDAAEGVGDPVDGLRVGVVENAFDVSADAVGERVRETLSELPVEAESVSLPTFESLLALSSITGSEFAALIRAHGQVYGTGTGYSEPYRAALAATDPDELGENVRDQLAVSAGVLDATDGSAYVEAQAWRADFTRQVIDLLSEYDALVTPTTPKTALEFGAVQSRDDLVETLANTGAFDLTGHPALSVPCGDVEGRPVGLQVVTDYHDERTAVALGSAVEAL
jgi:aspartyl-tRNA(Asn)/glutamyl-tRNA(Gln) amidotransferase subunit A